MKIFSAIACTLLSLAGTSLPSDAQFTAQTVFFHPSQTVCAADGTLTAANGYKAPLQVELVSYASGDCAKAFPLLYKTRDQCFPVNSSATLFSTCYDGPIKTEVTPLAGKGQGLLDNFQFIGMMTGPSDQCQIIERVPGQPYSVITLYPLQGVQTLYSVATVPDTSGGLTNFYYNMSCAGGNPSGVFGCAFPNMTGGCVSVSNQCQSTQSGVNFSFACSSSMRSGASSNRGYSITALAAAAASAMAFLF